MVNDQIINKIPLTVAKDLLKARQVLNSQTSTMEIAKRTHIHHATIYRLRHHTRNFNSMTIDTCWKLANYPISKPLNYGYLSNIFTQVITNFHNISALSRKTHISRITLQRLSENENNLHKMNIITVVKLLKIWTNMKENIMTNSRN